MIFLMHALRKLIRLSPNPQELQINIRFIKNTLEIDPSELEPLRDPSQWFVLMQTLRKLIRLSLRPPELQIHVLFNRCIDEFDPSEPAPSRAPKQVCFSCKP